MKKVRSVYHKPLGERGFGRYIVGYTWFLGLFYNWKALKYNYSHEELWFPWDDKGEIDSWSFNGKPCGQCFSSTTRGKYNGVRFAPASEVIGKHPERWDYIEFEVEDEDYKRLVAYAYTQIGKKYDWRGVALGFISPVDFEDTDKWYCSEICCWLKWLAYVIKDWEDRISPRRSAMIMAKKYHEPKGLA